MTNQELKELFDLLERAGMNPQLCDTPVRYYENCVPAGVPADLGDVAEGDCIMLPRSLVGLQPTFIITVRGNSMRDAGIMEGDQLQVQMDVVVDDGDIVMASINGGECTVKALYTDEDGQRWLVPRNEAFEAILLTEDMDVRIVGKVVGHIKAAPRVSYRDCQSAVRRTRSKGGGKEPEVSRRQVEEAVMAVAPHVENGRQWYAVYRKLVDRKAVGKDDYSGFVKMVTGLVPEHGHLPVERELRRMAVQSFAKPVALWEPDDAPVSGGRFYDYLRIARLTAEKLQER